MAAKLVLAALRHVWTTLESTHCPRALIGGLSLSFWKHVRSTQGVDLILSAGVTVGEKIIVEAPASLSDGATVAERKP